MPVEQAIYQALVSHFQLDLRFVLPAALVATYLYRWKS